MSLLVVTRLSTRLWASAKSVVTSSVSSMTVTLSFVAKKLRAPEERQRADRDDERRQAELRDQKPLCDAVEDGQRDRQQDREHGVEAAGYHHRAESGSDTDE
jgi:hypothetical protein